MSVPQNNDKCGTYVSISHNNDMSGVVDGSLPLGVHSWAGDPARRVHGELGHAHWPIAVGVRRNGSTGGRERGRETVGGGGEDVGEGEWEESGGGGGGGGGGGVGGGKVGEDRGGRGGRERGREEDIH